MAVLELANNTLTTPFLIDLVDQADQSVPEDVKAFVREIYRRNALRNDRLKAQLEEAVAALNERDVIPVLLKGSAILATAAQRRATQIMADLDILVDPDQAGDGPASSCRPRLSVPFSSPAREQKAVQ